MKAHSRTRLFVAALTAVFVSGLAIGASAADVVKTIEVRYNNIRMTVDGKPVISDTEPFIVVSEGRTYVGARALAEALGAEVEWDGDTYTVVVKTNPPYEVIPAGNDRRYRDRRYQFELTVPGTWAKVENEAVAVTYGDPLTAASVSVAVNKATSGATLDDETDAVIATLRAMFKVTSVSAKETVTVAGQSARKFDLVINVEGIQMKQQVYVLLAHDQLYVVSFAAQFDQFANAQNTFDRIRASFTLTQ